MEYFIHAKFVNETGLDLYEHDTDICIEVDSKFRKFISKSEVIARFEQLVSNSIRLRKIGKPNQFYLLEAVCCDDHGRHCILKRWNI